MNDLRRVETLLADAVNLLDDVDDGRLRPAALAVESALALVLDVLAEERRSFNDEAYERAAARYDGTGKDWR